MCSEHRVNGELGQWVCQPGNVWGQSDSYVSSDTLAVAAALLPGPARPRIPRSSGTQAAQRLQELGVGTRLGGQRCSASPVLLRAGGGQLREKVSTAQRGPASGVYRVGLGPNWRALMSSNAPRNGRLWKFLQSLWVKLHEPCTFIPIKKWKGATLSFCLFVLF